MAFFHSPTIPKENLQILMDFANPACYPGSGTTINNLAVPGRNLGYIKNSVTTLTNKGFNVLRPNGGGAGLNAVGDRIDINTSEGGVDRFGPHSFSFVFWTKAVGSGRIFSTGSAGSGNTDNCVWQMWIDNYGQYYWWDSGGGGTNNITCSFTSLVGLGGWRHLVVTYAYNEGGNDIIRVYIDGALDNSSSIATSIHSYINRSGQTDLQWTLGGGYYSSCYTINAQNEFGMFACYNRTLSAGEVSSMYNNTKTRFQ